MVPRYTTALVGRNNSWNLQTVNQAQLNGKPYGFPQGRILGGSGTINGMIWTRGLKQDFDAWEELGNEEWNWRSLLPYFEKSENYTENLNASTLQTYQIFDNSSTHGKAGPIHISHPDYIWPQTKNFFQALDDLGL
jgi:choline dehydrogenase